MQKEQGFLVYQEAGKTYIMRGNNITDYVGLKMLKASNPAIVNRPNVKHIKQLIMRFNIMTKNGETIDLTGRGIGFYNIPIENIVEVF